MEVQKEQSLKERYSSPLDVNKVAGIDYAELYRKTELKEQYTREEKYAYREMKKKEEYYKEISIDHIGKKLKGVRRAKDKWRLESGNLVYSEDQAWLFVSGLNSDKTGRFGPSVVATELGLNPFQVIDWYTENFGVEYDEDLKVSEEFLGDYTKGSGGNKNNFSPPSRNDENWDNVFRYLNEKRNIPSVLLNKLFESGKLYADFKSRCIFLSNASAEIRATPASDDPGFKGCVQGGQADVSGFSVMPANNANESVITIIEAAIDAISYNAMFPGRYAFSSNGSGRFGLHYKITLEALANGFNINIGTDADSAGDIAAQKIFNALMIRQYLYAKYKSKGISYKDIDQAIINEKIHLVVEESPHHLFFNDDKILEEYSVFEKRKTPDGKTVIEDTGFKSEKEFKYKIYANELDFIPDGEEMSLKVSTEQVNKMKDIYKIERDRPTKSKDWNGELVLLGSAYAKEYNKSALNNFIDLPRLPDYLEKLRKTVKPIVFDENNNPVITDKKITADKSVVVNNKEVEINQDETVLKVKYNRQELFNIIYLRYYLNQQKKISFKEVDEQLRNKEIRIFTNKNQPYLNFVDNKWSDQIEYIPKEREDGDKVFLPPTIRYMSKDSDKLEKLIVNKKAFLHIVKIIDDIANNLIQSDNQKNKIKELGIDCFSENKEGWALTSILGKGNLLKKHTSEDLQASTRQKMKI